MSQANIFDSWHLASCYKPSADKVVLGYLRVASAKAEISALRLPKLIGVNWRIAYSILKQLRNSMGHRDSPLPVIRNY